jgi:uncharacterized protein
MHHKTLALRDAQVKFAKDGASFAGYASVFNGTDSYGDTILPGAYKDTLAAHGLPKMFVNHDGFGFFGGGNLPVGKWTKAVEDDTGLFVEGEFTPGMARAEEVRAALKHGTVDGLSIGYHIKKADYEEKDDESGGRLIKRVSRLAEISVVTFPADEAARVDLTSVKSEEVDAIESIRDFERFLRDAGGLSKGLAQALVSRARVLFAAGEPSAEAFDAKAAQELQAALQRITARLA